MGLRTDLVHAFARAQGDVASIIETLPTPIQTLLVNVLGNDNKLANADNTMKIILSSNRLVGTPLISKNAQRSRAYFEEQMRVIQGRPLDLFQVDDFTVPSSQDLDTENPHLRTQMAMPAHEIPVRHYIPKPPVSADEAQPLLLYFHGGGFVVGSRDTHDEFCRHLALYSGMQVLSVDYRLAPEDHAPAAVLDCLSVLQWAYDHAHKLGADPKRIYVGGDSAGGNLAAVISQFSKHTAYAPKAQLLIYPVTDASTDYPSHQQYGSGYTLTLKDRHNFDYFYIHQSELKPNDPLVSPLLGDLEGVAPAYVVTAEIDLLVDEGEAYAHKLRKSGITTFSERLHGLPHGFINMMNIHTQCRLESIKIAQQFATFVSDI